MLIAAWGSSVERLSTHCAAWPGNMGPRPRTKDPKSSSSASRNYRFLAFLLVASAVFVVWLVCARALLISYLGDGSKRDDNVRVVPFVPGHMLDTLAGADMPAVFRKGLGPSGEEEDDEAARDPRPMSEIDTRRMGNGTLYATRRVVVQQLHPLYRRPGACRGVISEPTVNMFREKRALALAQQQGKARRSMAAQGELPMRRATFVYMSMAATGPSDATYRRSCFLDSVLIFLCFLRPCEERRVPRGCRYETVFLPRSTWTSGRNRLYEAALATERRQGWRFEFLMFTDDDAQIIASYPERLAIAGGNGSRAADGEELFRELVLRDRPLRASVQFGDIPVKPLANQRDACGVACFTDAIVDLYHRTAAELFLPYNAIMDRFSWHLSAYMQNILFSALAPRYCNIYRQVRTNFSLQAEHADYPRATDIWRDNWEWQTARMHLNDCLARFKVVGFDRNSQPDRLYAKWKKGLFGEVHNSTETPCMEMSADVDYREVLVV